MLLTFGNVILCSTFIYKLYCLKWFSAVTKYHNRQQNLPSLLREGVGEADGRVVNVQTRGLHRRSMNAPTA